MSDEEKEFLVGSRRPVRYGTTTSSTGVKQPRILRLVKHKVENSDTLQGIALKYDSPMVEIKRLNKLWSSDSIHLREYLDIPIFDNVLSPTGDGPVLNGNLKPTDLGSKSNISPSKGPAESLETSKVQPVDSGGETSIDQILSRIDSNIKSTAKNVKRMAKNSSVEAVLSSPSLPGEKLINSNSNTAITSLNEVEIELEERSASPSVVVQITQTGSTGASVNGRKLRPATKERLQRLQEQFFEL